MSSLQSSDNNYNCFNCHSYIYIPSHLGSTKFQEELLVKVKQDNNGEKTTTANLDQQNDIEILGILPGSDLKTAFIEALSCVFGLQAGQQLSALQQLNMNQMRLCGSCDEHLTAVYKSRKPFLGLTAPTSRVFGIMNTKSATDTDSKTRENQTRPVVENQAVVEKSSLDKKKKKITIAKPHASQSVKQCHVLGHELKKAAPSSEPWIKCPDCPNKFKLASELKTHAFYCPNGLIAKPFPCFDCGKRFKRRQTLTTHMIKMHK